MHPSSLLTALTIGLFSLSLVQGSERKPRRVNRLKSLLPNEETAQESDQVVENVVIKTAVITSSVVEESEPTGIEVLVSVSASAERLSEQQQEEVVEGFGEFNPEISLEDRRIAVFHGLYSAYERVVGRYGRPGVIEWSRVNVFNWPEHIDKSDMSLWDEDAVEFLTVLIESYSITFKQATKGIKNPPAPLVLQRAKFEIPATVSAAILKNEPAATEESDSDESVSISENEAETPKSAAGSAFKSIPTVSSSAKAVAPLKSKSKKVGKMSNFKSIKVDSDMPADPIKKEEVLARALEIYREMSGDSTADRIDWSLAKVIYLQNHRLPFSTDFKTEGDVLTLEAAMKHKEFGFYNLQTLSSRRSRIYERLYQLYAQVPNLLSIDPFIIKWHHLNVKGWPKSIGRTYASWKKDQVDQLEALLNDKKIKFTLKKANEEHFDSESVSDFSDESESEGNLESVESEIEELSGSKRNRAEFSSDSEIEEIVSQGKVPAKKIAKTPVKPVENSVAPVSSFADESAEQMEIFRTEIAETIENLISSKGKFSQGSRHQRIINELLKCFDLLHKHANLEIVGVNVAELLEFMEVFNRSLASISADGEMDHENLKNFVISGIQLRARLSGIEYKFVQGKRVLQIPKSRIRDLELFGFLNSAVSRWVEELQLLELCLDNEEDSIFCQPGSKFQRK